MSATVIPFPRRARQSEVRDLRTYRPPRGELMKWEDFERGGASSTWVVDWWAGSEDSACMMGRFATEAEADAYIDRWNRQHPVDPGAA